MIRSAFDLDPLAVYRAPSGRLCRLYRDPYTTAPISTFATLLYLRPAGAMPAQSKQCDGFTLTRSNWWILKAVNA